MGRHEVGPEHYIRTVRLRISHQHVERVKESLKETALSLSSVSGMLSFVAMESLEEPDTLILWELYVSRKAFDRSQREDGPYLAETERVVRTIEAEEVMEYSMAGGYLCNAS